MNESFSTTLRSVLALIALLLGSGRALISEKIFAPITYHQF